MKVKNGSLLPVAMRKMRRKKNLVQIRWKVADEWAVSILFCFFSLSKTSPKLLFKVKNNGIAFCDRIKTAVDSEPKNCCRTKIKKNCFVKKNQLIFLFFLSMYQLWLNIRDHVGIKFEKKYKFLLLANILHEESYVPFWWIQWVWVLNIISRLAFYFSNSFF